MFLHSFTADDETKVDTYGRGTFKNVTGSTKTRDALLEKQGYLVNSPRK